MSKYGFMGFGRAEQKSHQKEKITVAKKSTPAKARYRKRGRKVRARRAPRGRKPTSSRRMIEAVVYDKLCARNDYIINAASALTCGGTGPTTNAILSTPAALLTPGQLAAITSLINAGASLRALHFRVQDSHTSYMFQNQSNGNANLTCYYCVARRDVPASETSIINTFSAGLADAAGAPPAATDYEVTPFMSPRFCAYFRVYKVKKVEIPGGGTFTTKVSWQRSFTINSAVDVTADLIAHRGRTKFILAKLTGQPTNDLTTKTNYGLSAPRVDIICSTKISYTWLQDAVRTVTLASSTGFGTVGAVELVTEMGQAVAAEALA